MSFDFFYFNLTHRNQGLVETEAQKRIKETKIGIAGLGMGSVIAEMATRMGFEKFFLCDGDYVETVNLNHQIFTLDDLGKNKTEVTARKMKKINPGCEIEILKNYLKKGKVIEFVSGVDIVIDSIDPNSIEVSKDLAMITASQNKYYFYPIDFGWGARLYVFSPDGEKFEDFVGNGNGNFFQIMEKFAKDSPRYLKPVIAKVIGGEIRQYPQPITAAAIAGSLTIAVLIKLITKGEIKIAPEFYSFDPWI